SSVRRVIPRNVAAVSPSTKCSKVGAGAAAPRSWLAVIEEPQETTLPLTLTQIYQYSQHVSLHIPTRMAHGKKNGNRSSAGDFHPYLRRTPFQAGNTEGSHCPEDRPNRLDIRGRKATAGVV